MKIIRGEVLNDYFWIDTHTLQNYYIIKEDVILLDALSNKQMYLPPFDFVDYITQDSDINKKSLVKIPFVENTDSLQKVDFVLLNYFHYTWYNHLNEYLKSKEFLSYLNFIVKNGKYPEKHFIFSEFLRNLNLIRGIWIGNNPYSNDNANGTCYSTFQDTIPTSLKNIQKDLKSHNFILTKELYELKKKGILLLNHTLRAGGKSIPVDLNEQFWKEIIRVLNKKENFSILTFGDKPKSLLPLFNSNFKKYEVDDPAINNKDNEWTSNGKLIEFINTIQ